MYKNILTQIANIIFVNVQQLEKQGLFDGKVGIALFLYNYERYTQNEIYNELAGELIGQIYTNLSKHEKRDFFNGLAGIAYGIDYAVKNKFVEADEEDGDILEEVDSIIGQLNKDDFLLEIDSEFPLFSKGLYFLKRKDKYSLSKITTECLEFLTLCEKRIPFSYINSIFYFINHISSQDKAEQDVLNNILDKLFIETSNILARSEHDESNMYILKKNIESMKDTEVKGKWLKLLPTHDNVYMLSKSWMQLVYEFETQDILMEDIQKFIDEKCQNLMPEDLCIYNGLAGLGIELIKHQTKI